MTKPMETMDVGQKSAVCQTVGESNTAWVVDTPCFRTRDSWSDTMVIGKAWNLGPVLLCMVRKLSVPFERSFFVGIEGTRLGFTFTLYV